MTQRMSRFQFRTIRWRLAFSCITILFVACAVLGTVVYYNARAILMDFVDETTVRIAEDGGIALSAYLESRLAPLRIAAADELLSDPSASVAEKTRHLGLLYGPRLSCLRLSLIDSSGRATATTGETFTVEDREYFKQAMAGKTNVSDPLGNQMDGKMVYVLAVPVMTGNMVTSVLIAYRDARELSEFMDQISFRATGYLFMVNHEGIIIGHHNYQLVETRHSSREKAKEDPRLLSLVEMDQRIVRGEKGNQHYFFQEKKKYAGFAPVPNTRWAIGIALEEEDIFQGLRDLLVFIGVATLVILILGAWVMHVAGMHLTRPILVATRYAERFADGDFAHELPSSYLGRKDEIGSLVRAFDTLRTKITGVIKVLCAVSQTLNQGGRQISEMAQAVSSAASEQAASTEEVSASMEELVGAIRQNSENTQESERIVQHLAESTSETGRSTREAVEAMKTIAQKIGVVGEIASATDMVALNAAIEAARVGEYGKGFAVVAGEVRKLAERSQKAAIEITGIASQSVVTAEQAGMEVERVIPNIQKTADLMREISYSTQEQDKGAEQINKAIIEMDITIQRNVSVSEQLSALASEAKEQVRKLDTTLAFFKITEHPAAGMGTPLTASPAAAPPESRPPAPPVLPDQPASPAETTSAGTRPASPRLPPVQTPTHTPATPRVTASPASDSGSPGTGTGPALSLGAVRWSFPVTQPRPRRQPDESRPLPLPSDTPETDAPSGGDIQVDLHDPDFQRY